MCLCSCRNYKSIIHQNVTNIRCCSGKKRPKSTCPTMAFAFAAAPSQNFQNSAGRNQPTCRQATSPPSGNLSHWPTGFRDDRHASIPTSKLLRAPITVHWHQFHQTRKSPKLPIDLITFRKLTRDCTDYSPCPSPPLRQLLRAPFLDL